MLHSNESTDSKTRSHRKRRRTSISMALPTASSTPQQMAITPPPSTQTTQSPSYPSVIYTITSTSEVPTNCSSSLMGEGGSPFLTPSPIQDPQEADAEETYNEHKDTVRLTRMEADRAEQAARDMESALKEILFQTSCSNDENTTCTEGDKIIWNGNRGWGEDHTIRDVLHKKNKEQGSDLCQASAYQLNHIGREPRNQKRLEKDTSNECLPKTHPTVKSGKRQSNVNVCQDDPSHSHPSSNKNREDSCLISPIDARDMSPNIDSLCTLNQKLTFLPINNCDNDDGLSYHLEQRHELNKRGEPLNKVNASFDNDLSLDESNYSSFLSYDDDISYKTSFEENSFCQDSFVTAITVNTTADLSQSLRLNIDASSLCSDDSSFHTIFNSEELWDSSTSGDERHQEKSPSNRTFCQDSFVTAITVNTTADLSQSLRLNIDTSSLCSDDSSFHTIFNSEELWDSSASGDERHQEKSPSNRSVSSYKSCIEEDRIVGTTLCHSLRYTSSCHDVAIDVNSSPGIEYEDPMSSSQMVRQQHEILCIDSMRSSPDYIDESACFGTCTLLESDLSEERSSAAGNNFDGNRLLQLTKEDTRRMQIPSLDHPCQVENLTNVGSAGNQDTECCNMETFLDIVSLNSHAAETNAKMMNDVVDSFDSFLVQESKETPTLQHSLLTDEDLFFNPFQAHPKILEFASVCETLKSDNDCCVENVDVLREKRNITNIMEPAVKRMNQMVAESIHEHNRVVQKYESLNNMTSRWFAQVSSNIEGCYYYQPLTGEISRSMPPDYCDTGRVRRAALEALQATIIATKRKTPKTCLPKLHLGSIHDMIHEGNIELDFIRSVYPRNICVKRQKIY